jgi:pimeloyl-ACP methyl ester carboxylesterase
MSAVFSDERLLKANGIELACQEMGDPDGEPLILIMGLAAQMLAWEEEFCALLAERGFRVIRFDNRDIGHSTMLDEFGFPSRLDMILGRTAHAAYLIKDMAADTFGLMDALEIESAHVAGASMGGMIAQEMAIRHPERMRSMISMMSSTGARWSSQPSLKAWGLLFAKYPVTRDEFIDRAVKTLTVMGSPKYPMSRERVADLAGQMFDRSHNPAGIVRQMHAIASSGDRTPGLRGVRVPTTVLHGSADPLARPIGGKATARAIPGARLRIFEGMGHDLPRDLWPDFVEEFSMVAARAGAPVASRAAEAA